MGILELIRISIRAILINKVRALLTMLGIIIGVASVIVMLAIGESSKVGITSNISDMGSNLIMIAPKAKEQTGLRSDVSSLQSLLIEDYITLKSDASLINMISPIVTGGGQLIYENNFIWSRSGIYRY